MRWEGLHDELYDADDRAEIERLKTRLLTDLKAHRLSPGQEELRIDPSETWQRRWAERRALLTD
jgi:hypothetical protein